MKMDVPPAWSGSTLVSRCASFSKLLGVLGLFVLISFPPIASADASSSLSLAWDRSSSTDVVGYRVYFGPASRQYTNSTYVGNVTSSLVSGLAGGAPYYFAMTAIDATGLESDYSTEFTYTPTTGGSKLKVRVAGNQQVILTVNGTTGQVYDFLATTNMTTWSVLGGAVVTSDGQAIFVDSGAPSYRLRYYKARLR
jgi:hypothetical protein